MFEVIKAELEGDELFDSVALEAHVDALIASGKRNFAIDLGTLDYIYSDAINRFVNINHKVLNVYGRMALLSPGAQVKQILQRAGVHNFMKIYDSPLELQAASDAMIMQTSAISTADIRAAVAIPVAPAATPMSEFDDLRNELGKSISPTEGSFGAPPQANAPRVENPFSQVAAAPVYAPPPGPV